MRYACAEWIVFVRIWDLSGSLILASNHVKSSGVTNGPCGIECSFSMLRLRSCVALYGDRATHAHAKKGNTKIVGYRAYSSSSKRLHRRFLRTFEIILVKKHEYFLKFPSIIGPREIENRSILLNAVIMFLGWKVGRKHQQIPFHFNWPN